MFQRFWLIMVRVLVQPMAWSMVRYMLSSQRVSMRVDFHSTSEWISDPREAARICLQEGAAKQVEHQHFATVVFDVCVGRASCELVATHK